MLYDVTEFTESYVDAAAKRLPPLATKAFTLGFAELAVCVHCARAPVAARTNMTIKVERVAMRCFIVNTPMIIFYDNENGR